MNDSNQVTGVVCGDETFSADAVVFAVGITGMKKIVAGVSGPAAATRISRPAKPGSVDVLATRLWLDRKVAITHPSNACFGFHPTTGWTFV